jgi:hypothetical protein
MKRARKKRASGKQVQQVHRGWNQQSLDARNDKQVLERLDRLVQKSPRPKPDESDARWKARAARFVREFKSFFQQHGSRLRRLGIRIEDFGLLDPNEKTVPIDLEIQDPRYLAADEEAILRELSKDRLVRYTKLG